jgi:hypothetical protein
MNSREAELAIPLDQFISQAMAVLAADEILVESAKAFRSNPSPQRAWTCQRLQPANDGPFRRWLIPRASRYAL